MNDIGDLIERTERLLETMKAFEQGKSVQWSISGETWADTIAPAWVEGFYYRVKPEPRVTYLVLDKNDTICFLRSSEKQAKEFVKYASSYHAPHTIYRCEEVL